MLLMLDNYDSFTWNLVQYLGELGATVKVVRNDAITLDDVEALNPQHIVISPGPCTPTEAGISVPLIRRFAGKIPVLGVCLGHQAIGQAFGGRVIRAQRVMHGKLPSSGRRCRRCSMSPPRQRMARSWRFAIASCRSKASSFTPRRS